MNTYVSPQYNVYMHMLGKKISRREESLPTTQLIVIVFASKVTFQSFQQPGCLGDISSMIKPPQNSQVSGIKQYLSPPAAKKFSLNILALAPPSLFCVGINLLLRT